MRVETKAEAASALVAVAEAWVPGRTGPAGRLERRTSVPLSQTMAPSSRRTPTCSAAMSAGSSMVNFRRNHVVMFFWMPSEAGSVSMKPDGGLFVAVAEAELGAAGFP